MFGGLSRFGAIGSRGRADGPHIARIVVKQTYKAAGLVFPESPGVHGFFQDNTAPPELFNLDAAFQFGRKFFHNSNLRRNRARAATDRPFTVFLSYKNYYGQFMRCTAPAT